MVPSPASASFISIVQKTIEDSNGGASKDLQADLEKKLADEHQWEIDTYPNLERKMRGQELLKYILGAVLIALIITFPEEFIALYGSGSY